jgi:hypothetical protein
VSDARWPVRAPRAPAEGAGAPRPAGPGGDLRPRFSELLRQRRPAGPEDGPAPPGDATLQPVDALEDLLHEEADEESVDGEAADALTFWLPPEPAVAPAGIDMAPPELAAGNSARTAQTQEVQLQAPPQVRHLADTVAHFCNDRAVTNGDSWQVQIELRPDLLPATTLLL